MTVPGFLRSSSLDFEFEDVGAVVEEAWAAAALAAAVPAEVDAPA